MKGNDIFILQYPNGNAMSFSCGKINRIVGNKLAHSASTEHGSSGSPIILRGDDNYVIGLHFGGNKSNNWATKINDILEDISKDILKPNEIICVYQLNDKDENGKEIDLIHDYSENLSDCGDEFKKSYSEAREMNQKLFQDKIDMYINDEKRKFNFKYKMIGITKIKVKFKIKTKLTNLSYMFNECYNLKSIDLSSLNTSNVNNMSSMLYRCKSLESIDLSSFNTNNVTNMSCMFIGCSSLKKENVKLSKNGKKILYELPEDC